MSDLDFMKEVQRIKLEEDEVLLVIIPKYLYTPENAERARAMFNKYGIDRAIAVSDEIVFKVVKKEAAEKYGTQASTS